MRRDAMVYTACVCSILALLSAPAVVAQTTDGAPASPGRMHLGGSFLLWNTTAGDEDPPGPGFHRSHFRGSVQGLSFGGKLAAGIWITERAGIGGELAVRPWSCCRCTHEGGPGRTGASRWSRSPG